MNTSNVLCFAPEQYSRLVVEYVAHAAKCASPHEAASKLVISTSNAKEAKFMFSSVVFAIMDYWLSCDHEDVDVGIVEYNGVMWAVDEMREVLDQEALDYLATHSEWEELIQGSDLERDLAA